MDYKPQAVSGVASVQQGSATPISSPTTERRDSRGARTRRYRPRALHPPRWRALRNAARENLSHGEETDVNNALWPGIKKQAPFVAFWFPPSLRPVDQRVNAAAAGCRFTPPRPSPVGASEAKRATLSSYLDPSQVSASSMPVATKRALRSTLPGSSMRGTIQPM